MQVDIDKTFALEASGDTAWIFLQNVEGVASCMPGAEITERRDDSNYVGKVKAKVGPATMTFNGDIVVKGLDAEKRELQLRGSGQDSKGSSSATLDLKAWVVDTGGGKSELKGLATVTVTGKLASLGGRMMTQVADQILDQFGKNFQNQVLAMGEGEQAETAKEQLAEQPAELNGLAFAWSIVVGMVKGLLGAKKTPS